VRRSLTSSWQLVIVGMVFGLGLETASEVALLGLSATAASSAGASIAAVLSLPLLFAGGMALFDSLNALFMVHMYESSSSDRQLLRFNVGTTAVTAAIALFVGGVYASALLANRGISWLEPIAGVADHFEIIGYAVVAAYLTLWTSTSIVARRSGGRLDIAAATPAAMSSPDV